jgi:DNA/RNA endonuclease YhcR with UshA esterase domain
MKTSKITLIITLIGILTLTLLSQNKPIQTGIIESIESSNTKTTIHLQNQTTELIIFENLNLKINKGDKIKFQGKPDTYKNQPQIIISKLSLLK